MQKLISNSALLTLFLGLFFTANSFAGKYDPKLSDDFNDACAYDEMEIVKELAYNPKVDVNYKDAAGRTCLLNAVLYEWVEVVAFVVKLPNVDLNTRDKMGIYPLHYALYVGNYEIVRLLRAAGAREPN